MCVTLGGGGNKKKNILLTFLSDHHGHCLTRIYERPQDMHVFQTSTPIAAFPVVPYVQRLPFPEYGSLHVP